MLESLFNKVAGLRACNFIKKRLQHRCFPVKFANLLRTLILKNICERPHLDTIIFHRFNCENPFRFLCHFLKSNFWWKEEFTTQLNCLTQNDVAKTWAMSAFLIKIRFSHVSIEDFEYLRYLHIPEHAKSTRSKSIEEYLDSCKISMMSLFKNFLKSPIIFVWQGFKYASEIP